VNDKAALKSYGIHWFRRDLRIASNPALIKNFKENEGRVVGLFCFDSQFLSRPDFSHNRFAFFLATLKQLKSELRSIGSDLLVVDCLPSKYFEKLFAEVQAARMKAPGLISFCRDYEPFARERDQAVKTQFQKYNWNYQESRDHLVIEPEELLKEDGSAYKVYTPFSRKWLELFRTEAIQKRVASVQTGLNYLRGTTAEAPTFQLSWNSPGFKSVSKELLIDRLDQFEEKNRPFVSIEVPRAGSREALKQLEKFSNSISQYGERRDVPSEEGTSRMSIFLKNGTLNSAQVISHLKLQDVAKLKADSGELKYLKEIIWREFYYHILFHFPRVEKEAFISKYVNLKWENNLQYFEAWCKGLTGFPIVDAGMRQLNQTGWMHNRVRMIVASFLTKDLLIDWRWGEKYFMEKLLDGDLAPNNGGWQWAASTGCDPQPYFRIFNPWLQGERFDPKALYIKRYLPELQEVPAKSIHDPKVAHSEGLTRAYPKPIVVHSEQKEKVLALFK
jgi:deoxyribodipyrimidine photo-lyase